MMNVKSVKLQSVPDMVLGDGTPKKALYTAFIVGTILILINHGDTIVLGEWPPFLKVVLTYCTPYFVTTWGAVTGKRAQIRRDFSNQVQRVA